ncbi:MAG: ChbG/HpnK family deacetylase [bacterium]
MLEFQESHRHRIIVTADDFGISPRANRNILYLIELGKINRVAIMTEGAISPKEIDQLSRSGVKLDIHLDILHQFGDQRKKRQSAILRVLGFLGKILSGKLMPKNVYRQWSAQIEKFHTIFGKYPDGINSHEHVHFFPFFFSIALQLQKKYNIPYIRFGDSLKIKHHVIVAYIIHFMRILDIRACAKNGCISSSFLVSLDWIKNIDKFLNNPPEGTIEIACHPELAEDFVKVKKYF